MSGDFKRVVPQPGTQQLSTASTKLQTICNDKSLEISQFKMPNVEMLKVYT